MYVFKEVILDLITYLPTTEHSYDCIVTFVNRLGKCAYFVQCNFCIAAVELALVFLVTIAAKHRTLSKFISNHDLYFTSCFFC